ncbi:MAG: 5-formyltetrahydrofolate cyclo-ligase [Aerococcus viridans]|uniref:5-formyltetrahydrofolate cyclo-ligase n=1 Tax=Aerococcus agrisoli TaxID=2487350 RepID=A0A3N4GL57_9LACT|nr:5-formyltetrahydrofolate cyclo-ligase [Aerococcus agrisoli]OYW68638.1 MAG: 5-formyltetrahydrofolate cyclo-ligase [Aerococcus viridans]RPA63633.1 5-formyltetrahydrofolate cyclo-ligase [Aerococcus agrisoli]
MEKVPTTLSKQAIRDQVFAYWQALPQSDRIPMQADLYAQLFNHPAFESARTIAVTMSHPGEIDTKPIIDYAITVGKQVVVPKTLPKRQMTFGVFEGVDRLARTKFGILEPKDDATFVDKKDIDLMIVPGLFFTKDGYRIGHGGGYYDIYLADYKGQTISLALPGMMDEAIRFERDDFDIPVNHVLLAEA